MIHDRQRRLSTFVVMLTLTGVVGAACSSTAGDPVDVEALLRQDASETTANVDGSDGLEAVTDEALDVAGRGSGAAAGTPSTRGAGAAGRGGIATAPGEVEGGTAAALAVPMGPGVTADKIEIGFMVTANLQAAFGAIGASGQPPDEIDLYRTLVAWANDNGGIAGRRIDAVMLEVEATGNWQSQAQQACSRFTEDRHVAVVVSSVVGGTDALARCLAGKGVPLVEQNHWLWDQQYWDELGGLLFQPSRMRPDRSIPAAMKTLADGGFFAPGHKLGLVRFDGPVFDRLAENVMKPAIAANGGNLVSEVTISSPGGASDLGGVGGQLSGAILRFRQADVTHVLFLENAGILPFFWNHEANSQGYYPRLGLMSNDLPGTQANQVEPRVLEDSLAAGWIPSIDVFPPEMPPNPARQRCADLMTAAGMSTEFGFGFYHTAACDAVFFLKTALDDAPALTPAGLRQSVERLGSSYESPYTWLPTQLGPGRHDGAATIALAAYGMDCECYRYTSSPQPVP